MKGPYYKTHKNPGVKESPAMTQIPATVELAKPICPFCADDRCGKGTDHGTRSPQAAQQVAMALTPAQRVEFARKVLPDDIASDELMTFVRAARKLELKDACQICQGHRGGVPGNENVIQGVVMCDYCSSTVMALEATGFMLTKECDS